jgi:hypothetical protein
MNKNNIWWKLSYVTYWLSMSAGTQNQPVMGT